MSINSDTDGTLAKLLTVISGLPERELQLLYVFARRLRAGLVKQK